MICSPHFQMSEGNIFPTDSIGPTRRQAERFHSPQHPYYLLQTPLRANTEATLTLKSAAVLRNKLTAQGIALEGNQAEMQQQQ